MIQRENFPRANQPRANPPHSPSSCPSRGKPGTREAASLLPKWLLLMLFAFMILQKNIHSLKIYYFIQTLLLLFSMMGRMKTEYFGWSGNINQFQEINMRARCLLSLGFSSLAFHINPLQTLRSCAGLLTIYKL